MNRLKYVKISDLFALIQFLIILPFALFAKIFLKNYWLICEDKNEARDNGYWLYKWIRENHPEQKLIYAINKKCVDYKKVKDIGKVISYGGWIHWFWYIVAEKNISSQKGGKPNAAVGYLFEVAIPIWKHKRYFLQHGVIKDDLKWLYNACCKFSLFVTSTIDETKSIQENYGYPEGVVQCLGLARFDSLHDFVVDNDLILVMPTWRRWLANPIKSNKNLDNLKDFSKTDYCIKWNEFLNSQELHLLLKKYDKKIIFYPHRNMQKFIGYFNTEFDNIKIANSKEYDVQDLLKKAALLITDYSSVFFDFAYMLKPVIFYQFDEKKFRENQYQTGYFDYSNNVIGSQVVEIEKLLNFIDLNIKNQFKLPDENKQQIKNYFKFYDSENCKRNYEAINKL